LVSVIPSPRGLMKTHPKDLTPPPLPFLVPQPRLMLDFFLDGHEVVEKRRAPPFPPLPLFFCEPHALTTCLSYPRESNLTALFRGFYSTLFNFSSTGRREQRFLPIFSRQHLFAPPLSSRVLHPPRLLGFLRIQRVALDHLPSPSDFSLRDFLSWPESPEDIVDRLVFVPPPPPLPHLVFARTIQVEGKSSTVPFGPPLLVCFLASRWRISD